MLQPASLGRFWLGPQSAKDSPATTYYGFRANLAALAPNQQLATVGPTVGGTLTPPGSVKVSAMGAGEIVMQPALDDYLGWLLYAFAGSVSSVDNGGGIYTHHFPSGADDDVVSTYLTARRKIPGSANLYEQIADVRPYRLLLALQPASFAMLRTECVGRTITSPDGAAWTYAAKGPEDSCPVSCLGHIELPDGTVLNAVNGVSIDIASAVPRVQDVQVNASLYPYDFPVVQRNIQVAFNLLWENPDLYNSVYYDGTDLALPVHSTSFDVLSQSAGYITGTTRYELGFWCGEMDWQCQPLRLQGGSLVECQFVGTMHTAASGIDWELTLKNGTAGYSWPT